MKDILRLFQSKLRERAILALKAIEYAKRHSGVEITPLGNIRNASGYVYRGKP